jgi:signal transduction histidine kinase
MRLFGSLSFRLALVYAGLFTASVALLGALVYWIAIAGPMASVRAGLERERDDYAALARGPDRDRLAASLDARAAAAAPRAGYHALIGADGRTITTNLPSWPQARQAGWLRIEADVAREGDEDDHEALAIDIALADGGRLIIGRDIEDLDGLEEALRETLTWLLPALVLLTLVGGAVMSRVIGRRLDSVSRTARRVMDGDLGTRIRLRGTDDDFDRLAATLNLMLDRIEASLAAVRRVSDNVAHELRTPLSRLRAALEEAAAGGADAGEPLRQAAGEAERLQAIFDALLRISRIEAARHQAAFAPVALSTVLHDAADYYRPAAEEAGQRIDVAVEKGLETMGDRDLIFQAISNLLDNAVKFTPAGGRIELAARADGDAILVTVADSGPGIDEASRARVGERFFRAPATAHLPGLGLGLSLVKAVSALHQSSIRFLEAQPGLRVEWWLPQRDRDA